MVVLLADIHLAEAAADNRNLNLNEINVVMAHRYEEIFQRHGITTEQFMSSYNYYLEHADQLTAIYEEVLNRLSTGESRANEGRRARVVNDSMRNVSMMVRDSVPAP